MRLSPWGVAPFNLKTPECGPHILFLSPHPQHGGGNSHDDRTSRICARPSMGQVRPGNTHTTVVITVAWAVLCLLVAQRVTSAALARALPAEQAGSGRSCLRRVRRWWQGPALEQATISPALIHLALTLVAGTQPIVAMD